MTVLATFLAALAGFAALSLSMPQHRDASSSLAAPILCSARSCRILGWGLLAGSIVCATLMEMALAIALTTWVMVLTASSLSVALLLTYNRPKVATVVVAAPLAAFVSLLVGLA